MVDSVSSPRVFHSHEAAGDSDRTGTGDAAEVVAQHVHDAAGRRLLDPVEQRDDLRRRIGRQRLHGVGEEQPMRFAVGG